MGLLNIKYGKSVIQAFYEYDEDTSVYRFHNDIKIGEWTISRNIILGGPTLSNYKFDFRNYLQFVITDKKGESKIKNFYYNNDNTFPYLEIGSGDDTINRGIRRFLEKHPLFSSQDWQDYDNTELLFKIRDLLKIGQGSASEIVDNIRKILG